MTKPFPTTATRALGITDAQLEADARQATDSLPVSYTTPAAVETLRRARARVSGRPQPVTGFCPNLPPTLPIVLATDEDGSMHVDDGTRRAQLDLPDLPDWLRDRCGVSSAAETHRTLSIDTPRTARDLSRLLASMPHDHDLAPVLDWWLQRLDFPGTGAVLILTDALARRWVTGTSAEDEANISTWATWLSLAHTDLLDRAVELTRLAGDGHTLPGLLDCHTSDTYSWKRMPRGRGHWHRPDTRRNATLGLLARNQASEHYASLLLDDPLHAQVAARTGHLLAGTVTATTNDTKPATVTITTQSPLTRLRTGDQVAGWIGSPADAADAESTLTNAVATRIEVTSGHGIELDLATIGRAPTVGAAVTVRPRRTDPHQQRMLLSRISARMQQNWLTRQDAPTAARRNVPMDVIIAAAETNP